MEDSLLQRRFLTAEMGLVSWQKAVPENNPGFVRFFHMKLGKNNAILLSMRKKEEKCTRVY